MTADPLSHEDLVAGKAALGEIVRGLAQSIEDRGLTLDTATAALACLFIGSCRAYGVEPVDVLEQIEDADATDDLPPGALAAIRAG